MPARMIVAICLLFVSLSQQTSVPACTITAAQLTITPDTAQPGTIVLARARVSVASPCVMRPILRVPASLVVHQYADASSLGDALIEWPITATAAGTYRVDLLIDGALWGSATLTVGEPPPAGSRVWLPLIAAERAAGRVWLPLVVE